jgi:hypothetical protein
MNKTSIIGQLNRLDTDRLKSYRELLDFYHGRQWEGRERRGEKRLTFNYTKVFIDKITSYLMSGVSFVVEAAEDSAEAKTKAQRAEAALNQVYEESNLEQLDLETEIDCAIMGDASYKVTWDGEAKRVRITAPDVQGLYAWWLGDDITRVWRVASRYQLSAEESQFIDNLWHEPVPFNLVSQYGLAIAHHGNYAWLSAPYGVWRAKLTEEKLDLSADVLALKEELAPATGKLSVELANDDGKYSAPGDGDISLLDIGCQLDFSPGYATAQGEEVSSGPAFLLESHEHISAGGKASLVLHAFDGWRLIENWRARHQFRWNQQSDEMSVKEILAFVLGRVGLKLEVKSASSALTSDYPDFAINPGNGGADVIRRLLSFVPDVLFIEGDTAYVVNPLANDESDYAYGSAHAIFEGSYLAKAQELNRLQVEGYDPTEEEAIVVDAFAWEEIDRLYDRTGRIEDRNIESIAAAEARGESYLRKLEMESVNGAILIPVNCGQQLYDVIDITDSLAGLAAAKRRVNGLTLVYSPQRGEYRQRLLLGGV